MRELIFGTRRRANAWAAGLSLAGAWPHVLFSLIVATPIVVGFGFLALAVWIPSVISLGVLAIRGRDAQPPLLWAIAISYLVTAVPYLIALPVLAATGSDNVSGGMQWVTMAGFYALSTLSGVGAWVAWRAAVGAQRDADWG